MRTTLQLTAVAMVLLAIPANGARGIGSQAPDPPTWPRG